MEAWFQRACARDPQHRFASAQEFADALRVAAGGSAQPTGQVPGLPSAMPSLGNPGNPAHAVSVGTASGMSRSGDTSAQPVSTKAKGALVVGGVVVLLGVLGAVAVVGFGKKDHGVEGSAGSGPTAAGTSTATAVTSLPPPPTAAPSAVLADPEPTTATSVGAAPTSSHTPSVPSAAVAGNGASAANPHGGPIHVPVGGGSTSGHAGPTPPAGSGSGPRPIDLGY
jgi:serine/threonine-protein kinase